MMLECATALCQSALVRKTRKLYHNMFHMAKLAVLILSFRALKAAIPDNAAGAL
jgi:hypothetical protein